jgi:hypothetical protein
MGCQPRWGSRVTGQSGKARERESERAGLVKSFSGFSSLTPQTTAALSEASSSP